jgi:hypothetical protein
MSLVPRNAAGKLQALGAGSGLPGLLNTKFVEIVADNVSPIVESVCDAITITYVLW